MIFDEVDTMIYQPRSDNARRQRLLGLININVNRYQKSTIVLLNYLTSIMQHLHGGFQSTILPFGFAKQCTIPKR